MSDYINNYEYIQENPNVLNSNVNGLNSNPINPNISLAEAGASSNEVVSSLGLMNNQSQEQDNMLLLEEDKYTDICIGDSFQTMELLVDRIYSLYMDEDKHILKKIRQRNSAGNVSNLLFYCKLSGTGTHDPAAKIARQSKKCDCNFEIRANLSAKDNKWYVYKATPCHTGHNVNTSKEYAYLLDAQRMLRTASMQWLAAGHSCDFLRNDLEHFLNECHKRYQTSDHVPNNTSMNNTMSINDSNSMVSHMHSNEYLNINGSNSVAQPNVEPRVVVVGSTSTDSGAINISRKNDKKRLVSQTHLGAPENLQSVSSEQNQNQSESQDQAVYPHPGSNDFNHHSDISTMEPNKKKKT